MRQFNESNIARIRAGETVGNLLILVTLGKHSGVTRQVPVAFFHLKDESLVVVASAAGGAKHPAWYFNIGANPDAVKVVLAGNEFGVVPQELHGRERELAWAEITERARGFAQYQQLTDRVIPIIRLSPRG